jgi:hypothetical protein
VGDLIYALLGAVVDALAAAVGRFWRGVVIGAALLLGLGALLSLFLWLILWR